MKINNFSSSSILVDGVEYPANPTGSIAGNYVEDEEGFFRSQQKRFRTDDLVYCKEGRLIRI